MPSRSHEANAQGTARQNRLKPANSPAVLSCQGLEPSAILAEPAKNPLPRRLLEL